MSGRNVVSSHQTFPLVNSIVTFNTKLQLNINKSGLQTQRCSLTFNTSQENKQKTVQGIIFISLAKDHQDISQRFTISQCIDKSAEVEIHLKIIQLNSPSQNTFINHITPAQSQTSAFSSSLMEMKQFQKKIITPPGIIKHFLGDSLKKKVSKISTKQTFNFQLFDVQPPNLDKLKIKSKVSESIIERQHSDSALTFNNLQQKSSNNKIIEENQAINLKQMEQMEVELSCLNQLLEIETNKSKFALQFIQKLIKIISQPTHSQSFIHLKANNFLNNDNQPRQENYNQLRQESKKSKIIDVNETDFQKKLVILQKYSQINSNLIYQKNILEKKVEKLLEENELLKKQLKIKINVNQNASNIKIEKSKIQRMKNPYKNDYLMIQNSKIRQNKIKQLEQKIKSLQKQNISAVRQLEHFKNQFFLVQQEITLKEEQFDRYKKKIFADLKIQNNNIIFLQFQPKQVSQSKNKNFSTILKNMIEKSIFERKQLYKVVLKSQKIQHQFAEIEQKIFHGLKQLKSQIQKSFNLMLTKRLNKEQLLLHKNSMEKMMEQNLILFKKH